MNVSLDKKRFGPWALVTGASSGIGKEFARQIAASGINVVLVARREDLLKEVGGEFGKRYGVEHRVVVLDVSREDFIRQLAPATDDLDIGLVVSNAGTGNPGEFLKLDRQLHQATLRGGSRPRGRYDKRVDRTRSERGLYARAGGFGCGLPADSDNGVAGVRSWRWLRVCQDRQSQSRSIGPSRATANHIPSRSTTARNSPAECWMSGLTGAESCSTSSDPDGRLKTA